MKSGALNFLQKVTKETKVDFLKWDSAPTVGNFCLIRPTAGAHRKIGSRDFV